VLAPGDGLSHLDRHVRVIGGIIRVRAEVFYLVAAVT
jgi:hypothetical protein